jgi:hypothetical protein
MYEVVACEVTRLGGADRRQGAESGLVTCLHDLS